MPWHFLLEGRGAPSPRVANSTAGPASTPEPVGWFTAIDHDGEPLVSIHSRSTRSTSRRTLFQICPKPRRQLRKQRSSRDDSDRLATAYGARDSQGSSAEYADCSRCAAYAVRAPKPMPVRAAGKRV